MTGFIIRFLICNIAVSGITGLLVILKKLFKNTLSCRMQYNLWFILLGLLAVPFIPLRLTEVSLIFSLFRNLTDSFASHREMIVKEAADITSSGALNRINDFALSVNNKTASLTGLLLLGIWITGILLMIMLTIKSALSLGALKKSALPLQNPEIRSLYYRCLKESGIRKNIPIYSTAFLKSPVIAGLFHPCIYLPIRLLTEYHKSEIRYILLHELQHYKHKDALANAFMNLVGILYWFNPVILFALREMRYDKETACDASVLEMLDEESYEDYGNTLIHFAEKISLSPFFFASGIGGNIKQLKRRILNIASYEKPTFLKKLKSVFAFTLTTLLLLSFTPFISVYAADTSHYQWNTSSENISYVDLSSYFEDYEGSFVLYDSKKDVWHIYNMEHAALRFPPDSTYKIYDALFGLEEGVITPDNSFLTWNGETYPFEAWNGNQTLQSAMQNSVNWYFQTIDERLGAASVYDYVQEIGYGNKDVSEDFPAYWLESSLKISPIEQVELLTKLYHNDFGFAPENVNAVKDSLLLSSSGAQALYGKTGTGRVDGKDISGWFVGYVETGDNTYFFATNIKADKDAAGSNAAEITLSILVDIIH